MKDRMKSASFAKSKRFGKIIALIGMVIVYNRWTLQPLEKHFHLPDFMLVGLSFVLMAGLCLCYARVVWCEAAEEREALKRKHEEADAYLNLPHLGKR